mgnify:CR=1 FL=1
MQHFRKVWTEEMHAWMRNNLKSPKSQMYQDFLSAFPEIKDVTFTAFLNESCRAGAVFYKNKNSASRKARPIGSEQIKKGFVRVKVAQPNVWKFKSHIVWEQAHPGETVDSKTELVVFLDGNSRNFAPENLKKVSRKVIPIVNNNQIFGSSTPKGDPVEMKMRIAYAEHYLQLFDCYRKAGMLSSSGSLKTKVTERARLRRQSLSPEEKAEYLAKAREWHRNHPLTEEQKENHRKYQREWARKKREKERCF